MTDCTACNGSGRDPRFTHCGFTWFDCPTCNGTGESALPPLPRLSHGRLQDLAATGRLSQDEVQAERWMQPDRPARYISRELVRLLCGPDLINRDDPPSAYE